MKKSIRLKINQLIIMSIAILSFVMVVVNLLIINGYTAKDSERMMENTGVAKAQELNNQFQLVEQSVQTIYDISESMRPSVDELRSRFKAEQFVKSLQDVAITIAGNTEGAITIYYRLNPELDVSGTEGFFYVKSAETGQFEPYEITNLLDYSENDIEHVGWYYLPVQAGKPLWMEPYFNANIEVEMISYVVPIFDGKSLIGVVGMDIDFDRLIGITENTNIYKSSGAVLCSMSNKRIYYKNCDVFGTTIPEEIYDILKDAEISDEMFTYFVGNSPYKMYFMTLQNDMKLVLYANKRDINEQAYTFMFVSIVIFIVSIALTVIMAVRMTKKIMVPIETISAAAKQYAQGNWDVELKCDTDDELKVLTDNITIMAQKTKEYIEYIKDMAKKDGLTGLRNKTDYLMYVEKINTAYKESRKNYAVVVFDLNNLKKVNDEYGHEKGDELLVSASKFICTTFAHSPVFRIGGDEFVAILDSDDFGRRKEILEEFKKRMTKAHDSNDILEVCIACGMATFGEDGEGFEDLFFVADQRMYRNKSMLKSGREEIR